MNLKSESGSIVLGALAVATLIAIFAGAISTQIRSADDMTQLPRVRAVMAQIELQTRLAAFSATSYSCNYAAPANTTDGYECKLRNDVFEKIKATVDGGTVSVANENWDETSNRFSAQVRFDLGADASKRFQIAPRELNLEIPSELLQPSSFTCPEDRPIFAGYYQAADGVHKKGEANCKALPTRVCGVGTYVASINPSTLEPVCADSGRSVSCPANQYISYFSWNGGGSVNFGCTNRRDPFTEMGWTYLDKIAIDTTFNSSDPDTPNPAPPPLPGPDVVSWSSPASQPTSACYAQPPVNCAGNFSGCSVACGGGTQTYIVTQAAQNGGAACPYTNNFTMPCNQQACAVPTPAPTPAGIGRCTCMEGASDGACDSGTLLNAVNYENVTSCSGFSSNGAGSGTYCNCSFSTYAAATPTPTPSGSACRDSVRYYPCKSTACMMTDYTCPGGTVINKYRSGNVWSGAGFTGNLVSWTGVISQLCVAPAACVPPSPALTASDLMRCPLPVGQDCTPPGWEPILNGTYVVDTCGCASGGRSQSMHCGSNGKTFIQTNSVGACL